MRVKFMRTWPYEPKVRLKWCAPLQRWYFDAGVPMSLRCAKAAVQMQRELNVLNRGGRV